MGERMKSKIIVMFLPLLFIGSLVSACASPILRAENGGPIHLFGGGFLEINGSKYQPLQITYNLKVENRNNQGFTVNLIQQSILNDYVSVQPVFVPANSNGTMPLTVWVGGQSIYGKMDVEFTCDDGGPQFVNPFFYLVILGQQIEPPPISTCSFSGLNGCYSGLLRTYFCKNNQPTYTESCTKYCCEKFGGQGSFCSSDRTSCISFNNLPPGTEGNIAMLCAKDDCNDGIERNMRFLLRYKGWNVDAKKFDMWTEDELKQYDLMFCTDESNACNIKFNTPIYNAHINGVPFLEIPDTRSANGAYSFNYIIKKQASSGKDPLSITTPDYITSGYSGIVDVINGNNFITVEGNNLSPETKDLADSGTSGSALFKAKENYGHGRYAFVGWFYRAGITDLKTDGEIILNRTLKWLKYGDAYFGGSNFNQPKIGKIAFVCGKDDCNRKSELALIKFFRNNGYVVDGKSESSWTSSALNNYDFISCSDNSKGCKITPGSPVYNAHKFGNKGFLELPDSSRFNAAYSFGYVSSASGSRQSSVQVTQASSDKIFNGLPDPLNVTIKRWPLNGVQLDKLFVTDVAHPVVVSHSSIVKSISTIFKSDSLLTKGRYAAIGWAQSPDLLTNDGLNLLLRTAAWVKCGNSCI